MAATTLKEPKGVVETEQNLSNNQAEVELAKCECCGLLEECTPAYIASVREQYEGHWICGLCAEAVHEEKHRSKKTGISVGQALKEHMKFCQQFRFSNPPTNPTGNLISAMKHLLRRTMNSPRKTKGSVYPSTAIVQ